MSSATSSALDFSTAAINKNLSADQKIDLFNRMVRIRRFEQASLKYYNAGKMGGFLHLYIGQESVAIGTISLCGENDHVITAYRNHGHGLASGMSMKECMAENYGKQTGCSKGKGGSMHYFAPDKNYWGGHGIVGGQTPLGLGLAYGVKYLGKKGACLCYLGDGAVNQGAFHESLNIASLFDIPVIFVIENNGYSMGTSQQRSSAFPSCLAERAVAYDMAWEKLNGEDVYEVRARVNEAMVRARKQSKPMVLEITTFRYQGHSVSDARHNKPAGEGYRTKDEIERHQREHDPLTIHRNHLIAEKILTEEKATQIVQEALHEAEAAAVFAEQSAFPDPSEIFADVYWEVDNKTEAGATGRLFFND